MRRAAFALPLLAALSLPGAARADEVTDALREALRAYEAGQLPAARSAMEEALQLLSQRSASTLGAALPPPLPGWRADEAQTQAGGIAILGGATASRRYENAQGQYVEIALATDNPLIAQLGLILTNPMLAGAMGRLIRIGDQRAVQTHDGEIQMLVDNRILVTVRGNASAEARLAYARAIDVTKLTRR